MTDASLRKCKLSRWKGDDKRCRWCNKLLKGRQQRWCSDECPKLMLRNHYWSDARKAARERDKNRCKKCRGDGAHKEKRFRGLQVHHKTPINGKHGTSGCHHHLVDLMTLCVPCHRAEHV
jgi:hypothetical protein